MEHNGDNNQIEENQEETKYVTVDDIMEMFDNARLRTNNFYTLDLLKEMENEIFGKAQQLDQLTITQ